MKSTIILINDTAINLAKVCMVKLKGLDVFIYFDGLNPYHLIWDNEQKARSNYELIVRLLDKLDDATENKD